MLNFYAHFHSSLDLVTIYTCAKPMRPLLSPPINCAHPAMLECVMEEQELSRTEVEVEEAYTSRIHTAIKHKFNQY
jgi:hypothetical protein